MTVSQFLAASQTCAKFSCNSCLDWHISSTARRTGSGVTTKLSGCPLVHSLWSQAREYRVGNRLLGRMGNVLNMGVKPNADLKTPSVRTAEAVNLQGMIELNLQNACEPPRCPCPCLIFCFRFRSGHLLSTHPSRASFRPRRPWRSRRHSGHQRTASLIVRSRLAICKLEMYLRTLDSSPHNHFIENKYTLQFQNFLVYQAAYPDPEHSRCYHDPTR